MSNYKGRVRQPIENYIAGAERCTCRGINRKLMICEVCTRCIESGDVYYKYTCSRNVCQECRIKHLQQHSRHDVQRAARHDMLKVEKSEEVQDVGGVEEVENVVIEETYRGIGALDVNQDLMMWMNETSVLWAGSAWFANKKYGAQRVQAALIQKINIHREMLARHEYYLARVSELIQSAHVKNQ